MIEKGIFKCPACGKNAPYEIKEWQKKGDRWIMDNGTTWYYEITEWKGGKIWSGYGYTLARDCWHQCTNKEEEWNKWARNEWKCNHCNFTAKTFTAFIPNNKMN